tara:strand:- start:147 stop:962 length:816 start_codon:yes stop_codon:yes gene_type:complete
MSDQNIFAHTIIYNEKTRNSVPSGHIVLDNSAGIWELFETPAIAKTLIEKKFPENAWVGFFSPKFNEKTGLNLEKITQCQSFKSASTEAFLFTSEFDEAVYWLNPWLQGDAMHPGLMKISKILAQASGYRFNLDTRICNLSTSVYSHYLFAKPIFWREWLRVYNIYLDLCLRNPKLMNFKTTHKGEVLPIHAFVMERVPSMILNHSKFKASFSRQLYSEQFSDKSVLGQLLDQIEFYKNHFKDSGNFAYLNDYRKTVKKFIRLQNPEQLSH